MRRFSFHLFFVLLSAAVASPPLHAFPAGHYQLVGTPGSGTVIEISVSVPNGSTQAVAVTGGRIFGSPIVAATAGQTRSDSFCLGSRLEVTTEDSFGQRHTYIVELSGCVDELRDGEPDDQVGAYHEAGSNVGHVLKG